MPANILSAAIVGMDALPVQVEVDSLLGVPTINIVGLADTAVLESKERVRSGITNSDLEFPLRRIVVNLAPGDVRKEGPFYDVPIALGILAATGQIPQDSLPKYMFAGELSLTGAIRSIKGALLVAICARELGISSIFVPIDNASEAAVIEGIEVRGVRTLKEIVEFLRGEANISVQRRNVKNLARAKTCCDFSDIKGQIMVKRALEVAAAGGHNILLIGPPGSGKTMLASRLPSILPQLSVDESIEVTKIYSVAGTLIAGKALITERPFREPHHTISYAGLVGGGNHPRPGEVSLAHNGVLFLDEFPEFTKSVLQVLRQPLEEGSVTISRAAGSLRYPAKFSLVAAMNPCPCGYLGDQTRECTCTPLQVQKYRGKISGPLLDRIDIHIDVPRLSKDELLQTTLGESSDSIKNRIECARKVQRSRFSCCRSSGVSLNSHMKTKEVRKYCQTSYEAKRLFEISIDQLGLSGRAYERVLKVARTIADLSDSELIDVEHISEALQYRSLDRKYQ